MEIVERIKGILSKYYDYFEIYDLIGELGDDDGFCSQDGNKSTFTLFEDDYEIEVDFTTEYNVNKGFITISKDDDLKEVIPFEYEVEPSSE
jgi:hypothetical protein